MIWFVSTLGCGLLQAPEPPPDSAAACGRVYGSTVTTLEEMYAASTEQPPDFLSKKDWVALCVGQGLTPEQLQCADPRIEIVDPNCAPVLDPVRDRVQALREQLVRRSTP